MEDDRARQEIKLLKGQVSLLVDRLQNAYKIMANHKYAIEELYEKAGQSKTVEAPPAPEELDDLKNAAEKEEYDRQMREFQAAKIAEQTSAPLPPLDPSGSRFILGQAPAQPPQPPQQPGGRPAPSAAPSQDPALLELQRIHEAEMDLLKRKAELQRKIGGQ